MEIKRFLKPNLIKISLAFLCLGLTLKFIVPLFSHINIIPCKIFEETGTRFGLCPVNPVSELNQLDSYYLGFMIGDNIYIIIYLLFIAMIIPYLLSCLFYWMYFRFIKKENSS